MSENGNNKKERSIFLTILIPMLGLLIVEVMLFAGILAASGVFARLNRNDRDILHQQVLNRKQYMENYLVDTVSDLSVIVRIINERAVSLASEGGIDMKTLDDSAAQAAPLLNAVTEDLIRTIREKKTSGIFVILCNGDLSGRIEARDLNALPGIYIRDMDPGANPSYRNEDLLFKRAPTETVRSFRITSDNGWMPMFAFGEDTTADDIDYFYRPYMAAYRSTGVKDAQSFVFWNVTKLFEGEPESLTCTVPLILDDGTVYGILGVDLTRDYLQTLMPHRELFSPDEGSYVLALAPNDTPQVPEEGQTITVRPMIYSGLKPIGGFDYEDEITIMRTGDGYGFAVNGEPYYAAAETFGLYSSYSPLEHSKWALVGVVREKELSAFSTQVIRMIAMAAFLMMLIGIIGSIYIGRRISESVRALSREVAEAQAMKGEIPSLSRTGISEIDQLTGAITELSQDIADTKAQEQRRIEHERDYDLLTGLMNRRAFYRVAEKVFATPHYLNHAAMIMLDLDNLKEVNDTWGHDWGDSYIHHAAESFASAVPADTLVARVSGDEFFVLFYGYDDYNEIDKRIDILKDAISRKEFFLPGGRTGKILVSGGIVYCPRDGTEFTELMKLADFAMYEAKLAGKNRIVEFDMEAWKRQSSVLKAMKELDELLSDHRLATYYFQPIFDAHTGKVHAYESLMRVSMQMLTNPGDVINLARQTNRLSEVEWLTWVRTLECYRQLKEENRIDPGARLFINSIANLSLSEDQILEISNMNASVIPNVVIEITEAELMDETSTNVKRAMPGFTGFFALDDYGSGYNSEKTLLDLGPKYIKVDISIVRDIDTSSDKQRIVSNIVHYAHERDMLIITEGIETEGELKTVISLGVDLLQGFFLARPAEVPPPISDEAMSVIKGYGGVQKGEEGKHGT